jgi:hypothetical protein
MKNPERLWQCALIAALMVYCFWGIVLIAQNPGLQYDEALLVLGSVHMRHSPQELTLPHDPNTWFCAFGRCFPLMTVRYVGAIKEYACLPLFALFGARTEIVRLVSMLMGLLGIWGIATLTRNHVSRPAAAMTAFVIAIHPAYVDLTVFDNGTVSVWMGALGILCLAVSGYLRQSNARTAFWTGCAIGVGVWARANFLWLVAAIFAATLIMSGKRFLLPASHWAAGLVGALVGGSPLLAYQLLSKGGTWEAMGMFAASEGLRERVSSRWIMFSEAMLSDREHRAIWNGPPMPDWQRWLFPMIILAACFVCLTARGESDRARSLWARIIALTFLLLGAILFMSRMMVAEHHLIVLVPLAALVTVFASAMITTRHRWGRAIVAGVAALYVGSALYWQFAAIQGLHRSGGVGQWSDAIFALAGNLQHKYSGREVKILDWGLQNNLYVLSDGKLRSREIFWDASVDQSGLHRPWMDEIREGGIFLLNGPDNRQIPAASTGFLQALSESHPSARRFIIPQRNRLPYAEIFEVEPNTGQYVRPPPPNNDGLSSSISTGDVRFANQLEGFYQIEAGGWRWTKREFSVTLRSPDGFEQAGVRLILQLYIPDFTVQKLGSITLTARLGDRVLAPETYQDPGKHTFTRDIDTAGIHPGPIRIDFSLDKCLPPSEVEGRALGIVVQKVALESK